LSMGNLFEQGSKGISAAQMEAAELGLTFNDISGKKIEIANDAILKMQSLFEGTARVIAVHVAPFIKVLADRMVELANEGGGMGRVVFNAFDNIIRIAARLGDYFELLKSIWYGFQNIILSGAKWIVSAFNAIGKGIVNSIAGAFNKIISGYNALLDRFPKLQKYLSKVDFSIASKKDTFAEQLEKDLTGAAAIASAKMQIAYANFSEGSNGNKVMAFYDDIIKRADELKATADNTDLGDVGGTTKTSDFKQIDLSKTVVGGIQSQVKRQEVQVEQLDETNSLLEQIKRGMTSGNVAVAA